jgi:hypothetical protein
MSVDDGIRLPDGESVVIENFSTPEAEEPVGRSAAKHATATTRITDELTA